MKHETALKAAESVDEAGTEIEAAGAPDVPDEVLEKLHELNRQTLYGESGKPLSNVNNALVYLRHHPAFEDVLAFDAFRQRPLLTKPIPGSPEARRGGFTGRLLDDGDITEMQATMQTLGLSGLSRGAAEQAVLKVMMDSVADPLKQYVEECRDNWDGEERIDHLFRNYFVAEEQSVYTDELGSRAMMTLVLRALYPGAFQKMMPILEGPQDLGKSTALKALCPDPDWFADELPTPLNSKDTAIKLAGKWLVEIGEMDAYSRSAMEAVKAFLTRMRDDYRPPYGRLNVIVDRRCMFWGTTNRTDYLRDETGNVRFYPVPLVFIDLDLILRDRDQLIGEAAHRLEAMQDTKEEWWRFSDDAMAILGDLREERSEDDPWLSTVANYVEGLPEVSVKAILKAPDKGGVQIDGMLKRGLGRAEGKVERKESLRVAGILERIGWKRDGRFTTGDDKGQVRWVPKG